MYRSLTAFALFIATVLVQSAPAEALDPAPFDSAKPGTQLLWKDRSTGETIVNVVQEPRGYEWRFVRGNGETDGWFPFCLYCNRVSSFDEASYVTLWPLEVGKKVTLRRENNSSGKVWENVIEVTGTDSVTLPFGTFDVYVVEASSRRIGGSWKGQGTYLYAPALGWNVSIRYSDNEGQNIDAELIEYE